jgi:putative DNA primase/helicase
MIMPDDNVVPFQPSPASDDERARRLKFEVERLARQSPAEWMFWLEDSAKKHGIEPVQLREMIEATIKAAEKQARQAQAEQRQIEQRAERQRTATARKDERQRREQQRAQKEADKEAEKRQRELEHALAEIAKLPAVAHEQKLAALAERTGNDLDFLRGELSQLVAEGQIGAITSPPPELWTEPVNLSVLLTETLTQIRRYVAIHNEAAAVATVLWVAFSWVHEIAVHSPILRIDADDIDAGKSTLCKVLKFLTPRASTVASLSGPSLFRFVDREHPTLIMDNADKLLKKKPELADIIEQSWTRGTPVPRVIDGHTYMFDVFCPKVLAGVTLALEPGTLSRCINVELLPKLASESIEEFEHVDDDDFVALRRKWARWAVDHVAALKGARPAMADLNNRVRMNWRLQFAIADLAAGEWPQRVRKAAFKLTRERRDPSRRRRLLAALYAFFARHGSEMTCAEQQKLLVADPTSEWAEYNGPGRPITMRQIGLLLGEKIVSVYIHPYGKTERGYRVEQFERDFKHYLGKPLPKCASVRKSSGTAKRSRTLAHLMRGPRR